MLVAPGSPCNNSAALLRKEVAMEHQKAAPRGEGKCDKPQSIEVTARTLSTVPIDGSNRSHHSHSDSDSYDDSSSEFSSSMISSEFGGSDVSDVSYDENGIPRYLTSSIMKSSAPTYPPGEYEDDKAEMIAKLMNKHASAVTSSLVDRSNLIQSVTWLSHHVPGCVIKSLFKIILKARKRKAKELQKSQKEEEELRNSQRTECGEQGEGSKEEEEGMDTSNRSWGALLNNQEDTTPKDGTGLLPLSADNLLPLTKNHHSALLFVDISGFTKISVMLDVESLSNAINSYFQMIVNEVTACGGDILKFAGDAIFAEWKVSRTESKHNLAHCVAMAAKCAASIVANCSDYAVVSKPIGFTASSRRTSILSRRSSEISHVSHSSEEGEGRGEPPVRRRRSSFSATAAGPDGATLNVKCGLGAGHIVGIHVGDDFSRREYLILGDPIEQVAKAESAASHGEVYASPEAVQQLVKSGSLRGDWEEAVASGRPVQIADRNDNFFSARRRRASLWARPNETADILGCCDDLDTIELRWLKKMVSLYVHPVIVNDENERTAPMRRESDQERHLAEAELRNVYTCFITPLIDYRLTGDEEKDQRLFKLLNDIMNVTTREVDSVQGHLRQFILDDKGLVLICTFGLRGSTFPNMIAQRAVPFSLAIHKALEEELGVKSKLAGTFGKVYCGVVGGLERHEFAVLGPSVNLSARLMGSEDNPGILVDKNVRLLTSKLFFKPIPAVDAKGYDEPVPIFEPIRNAAENQWGQVKRNFVGRESEIKEIMQLAKDMASHGTASRMLFISAMSGTGKSTLMVQATAHVRSMMKKMNKRAFVTRNVSRDGDSRVPFSLFRSIFKDVLTQVRQEDEASQGSSVPSGDFSVSGQWDNLSLNSESTKDSTMSTDATRFRYVCQELNAPPEFAEVVGRRLLGLREKNPNPSNAKAKPPNLQAIVDFMADAFVRCTKHASLVLLALDDVQWMDAMSWKVVQAIFERGTNVLTVCGSRPPSSNLLSVDRQFWSDLHGRFEKEGRYSELSLSPFKESEVQEMIATTLEFGVEEIDHSFSHNVFTTSGGMPHYLSYVLESIKRNQLTYRMENGRIGMKTSAGSDNKLGFGSVNELLVYRLDALDATVRTVLHLSAVLGTEFDLLDAALAYEQMLGVDGSRRLEAAESLRSSFDVAAEEGIIEQSFVFGEEDDGDDLMDDEDNLCHTLGNVNISLKGRKAHPFYTENRRLRFTHDSWKSSILNLMLDERKREMHEHVAVSLERELGDEASAHDDFEKQSRVLQHWKSCGNFVKAATIALNAGGQLMLIGLNSQAILYFDDALDILKEMTGDLDVSCHGGISAEVLDAISPPELEYLIKLNIAKGKAYTTLIQRANGAAAYQSALDILNNTPCAFDNEFDRTASFPIFSGLFAVLKMGATSLDEKDLCAKFVEQARLNGDPVHYGRALAMEAETLGRLGNFEKALEVVERIKAIYDIDTQHAAICKVYASDRVAQAFAHSVNFHNALGKTQTALDTCDYIVEEIVPKSDPKNIHNMFCLVYAIVIFLDENGLAWKARDLFQERVVDAFYEHFGPGGSTPSKALFRPLLTMLDLHAKEDQEMDNLDELVAWAFDEKNFEQKLTPGDKVWASFSANPKAVTAEICFSLAKRRECLENRNRLLRKATGLMEASVDITASLPYANMYARRRLGAMKEYEKELGLDLSSIAE
ncbi:hypothetical protein ACHAXT_001887 [Thalassiosira profunda]